MSHRDRTAAPTEPPAQQKPYLPPPHDPNQDEAAALERQLEQHQTITTSPTPDDSSNAE
ncbi:MAG: hypothetical protein ABSH44_17160 [Bryobacteraceae bacterium]|jgi:hypothetical protein